jgi:hypothetical protein
MNMKMIKANTKKEPKKKLFKQDPIYKWLENKIDDIGWMLVCIVFGISLLIFALFWLQCKNETCIIHGIDSILAYAIPFIFIWELIYIWICKNEKHLEDDDVIPLKALAFVETSIILNIIIPFIYLIYFALRYFFISISIVLFWFIIGGGILYGFYQINKWILKSIRESRK